VCDNSMHELNALHHKLGYCLDNLSSCSLALALLLCKAHTRSMASL
jgi:hypothetical protein